MIVGKLVVFVVAVTLVQTSLAKKCHPKSSVKPSKQTPLPVVPLLYVAPLPPTTTTVAFVYTAPPAPKATTATTTTTTSAAAVRHALYAVPLPPPATTTELAPAPVPQPENETTITSAANDTTTTDPTQDGPAPAPQPEPTTEPAPAPEPQPEPEPQTADPVPPPEPQTTTTTTTEAPLPPPPPQTTTADIVVTTQAPQPPPPPPPQHQCSATNIAACAALTSTDKPPSVANLSVPEECTILANYARSHYNPTAKPLTWSPTLAGYAQASADYSATNNCWDCHTNSGPGTTWGQNLYLSKKSCAESYFGWVTNEAAGNDPVNVDAGHFTNVVGFAAPYKTIGCASSRIGQGATVCNYGL
ncbi:hypothetical protein BDR26DRAFT_934407 [Obelidium mucronatum]|nr:hypothetical protein BDR26DRAFT_934407 [Obelidium mucronatum]